MSTKTIGNIGISHAIHYFCKNEYTVSVPLTDAQDYDLVVDISNKLYKVQVKTTKQITPYGIPTVNVKSSGGTKGQIYSTVRDSNADFLYIYHTELDTAWFIPVSEDLPKSQLTLNENYSEFKV